jgi:hypothetical protein
MLDQLAGQQNGRSKTPRDNVGQLWNYYRVATCLVAFGQRDLLVAL